MADQAPALASPLEPRSNDLAVMGMLLLPVGVIAGVLGLAGATTVALIVGLSVFVVAVFIAPELGFYAYFASQAVDAAFLTSETAIATPGKVLALFLLLVYVIRGDWRNTRMLVSKRFVVVMLAFALSGSASAALAEQPLIALRFEAQLVIQTFLVVAAIHTLRTRRTVGRAVLFVVAGGLVASLIMLIGGGQSSEYRRGTIGEFANPNTTALGLSLAAVALPAAWVLSKRFLLRLACLGAGPLILAGTMMTGSRSALGAVVVAFLLGGVLAKGSGLPRRLLIGGLCLAIIVPTVAVVMRARILDKESQGRLEALIYREESPSQDSRMDIWKLSLETYAKHPLGFGYGNTQYMLLREHGVQWDVHSTYLSVLVDGGPIAVALFLYGLMVLLGNIRHIRNANVGIPAAILFGFVVFSALTHTIHFTRWFWIPVTLCLLLAEQTARQERYELARWP